jgi:hypothetical protein
MNTIFKSHRLTVLALLFFLAAPLLLILVTGCTDGGGSKQSAGPSNTPSGDTGSAALSIIWLKGAESSRLRTASAVSALDCARDSIATVSCDIYDDTNTFLTGAGPWPCSDRGGQVTGILPGLNRGVVIYGADENGNVIYQGHSSKGLDIVAGEVTDAGTIVAVPFVPELLSPENSSDVSADDVTLSWSALSNASQYNLLVADEPTFSDPLVNETTPHTSYTPLDLPVGTTFYWKVFAKDKYDRRGGESAQWSFTTEATVTCQPPALDGIGNKDVLEEASLEFTLSATDPDTPVGQLIYSYQYVDTHPTRNAEFDPGGPTFSWTPGPTDQGNWPVTFTVCDNCAEGALCDSEQIIISVGQVCNPPRLKEIGPKEFAENQSIQLTLSATDPDTAAGELSYSTSELPPGASFAPDTQEFHWRPTYEQAGQHPVTFTVCDDCQDQDGGLCDSEEVVFDILNVCRAPQLDPIEDKQLLEGETLTFTVTASDPDAGDRLVYDVTELPAGAVLDPDSGEFNWRPDFGQEGLYQLMFEVSDSCSPEPLTDSQEVLITVGPFDCLRPVLDDPGNQTVIAGQELRFKLAATDDDSDDANLSFSSGPLPEGATFDSDTREFSWTPTSGMAGKKYDVTFMVCDDCPKGKLCDSKTITITVDSICHSGLPQPILSFKSTEEYSGSDGNVYIRFRLTVDNRDQYPDDMFAASPHLPPCGLNNNASRTWVDIYNQSDARLYGFCALGFSENLDRIWFAVLKGNPTPSSVYITLDDRECNEIYTSNAVSIPAP